MFAPFSDEQLEKLETMFGAGRIRVVRGVTPAPSRWAKKEAPPPEPPWEVVFRAPNEGESNAFEGGAHDPKGKTAALRILARATVIGVSHNGVITLHDGDQRGKQEKEVRAAWDGLRAVYPAVHMASQGEIQELMGGAAESLGKE